jgi:hypothetical protein
MPKNRGRQTTSRPGQVNESVKWRSVHFSAFCQTGGKGLKTASANGANKGAPNSDRFPARFVFHGNAVAAGAIITRVGQEQVLKVSPVQGQSSLPTIGGHSESLVQGSDPAFAEVFSYGEVRTQADGILQDAGAVTTVSTSVRDLRMVNRPSPGETPDLHPIEFKAALLSLDLRSTHPRKGPPRIEFSSPPQFQGISLDNLPVIVNLRQELLDLSVMADLEARYRKDKKFFADVRNAFMWPDPSKPPAFGQKIPRMNGYGVTSIVRSIQWGEQQIDGHVLTKTGFGSIYFGEMLINEFNRRVTLVRVKMGSDTGADGSFGDGDTNGTWIPPE